MSNRHLTKYLKHNAKLYYFLSTQPLGGDYSYSGMHDHGKLPEPKEGGDIALLLTMVKKAQESSDELLTMIIKKEKNVGRNPKDSECSKKKQKK